LQADLPAAIFLVLHIPPIKPSLLPEIFSRATQLQVEQDLEDQEMLRSGHIYIAPPDCHLLVENRRVRLVRGPTENRHRPAIDPLFRSAAQAYGPRVIGVILSGTLDDGAAGLRAVKSCGGMTLVQDPKDALFPGMPMNAMKESKVDYCPTVAEMPGFIVDLVNRPVPKMRGRRSVAERLNHEAKIAEMKVPLDSMEKLGHPSSLSCPHCNGVLWEIRDGKAVHFRCRVGHAFSPENLQSAQSEAVEEALWSAVRALEEKTALARKLAEHAPSRAFTAR